ncbi:MAG: hypothetical protein ACKOWH_04420 [Rhodoluna sp.]
MDLKPKDRPLGLILVAALVGFEGLFVIVLAGILAAEIFAGESRSLATMIALVVLTALAGIWVVYIALRIFQGKRWARSGALYWQLVQLSVAIGSFTGQFASQAIGWSLIVPSVIVLVLIFTKPVINATMSGMRDKPLGSN